MSTSPKSGENTEDAIARTFEQAQGDQFKFNATRNKWLVRDAESWRPDDKGEVLHALRTHVRDTAVSTFHKATSVRGIESFCKAAPAFARVQADFDKDPYLLGTPSGVIDLRTGKSAAGKVDDLITKSTAVAPSSGVPSRWLQFLQEATQGDADFINYLQRVAGYCLTGDTREHALFFIFGDGGTGKSTFLNTIQRILGSYAKTAPMDTFVDEDFSKHPTELAMLAGSRMVAANETEQGRKWAASRIKSLTGGDDVTARFMRQDFFTFRPEFKLLFVGNFAPEFETVDAAMRRRFFVVPFDVKPARKDERLMDALAAEGPRILQWMIDGCLSWQRNGVGMAEKVKVATDLYFEDQDSFSLWIAECVDQSDYKACTPRAAALKSWNAFRDRSGDRQENAREFTQRLRRKGFKEGRDPADRDNRARVWFGMELRDQVARHG